MADTKISGLTAATAASTDDLVPIVDDPGGSPATKKITFDNFQKSLTTVGKVTVTQPATAGTLTISNNGSLITVGGHSLTLTTSNTTDVTLPTTGTLATLAGSESLSNKSITGALTMNENSSIAYDPSLSLDGKYTGITITGTAGATLAFGDLCYLAVADSRWELTDANAAATAGDVLLGICVLAAANDGDATTMLLHGHVKADTAFPELTIGAPVYVSTTAGDIQVAQPTGENDVIRVVGYATTADSIMFNPSGAYVTHVA